MEAKEPVSAPFKSVGNIMLTLKKVSLGERLMKIFIHVRNA